MIQPNLFIVGAPKCGTTAMYHYLKTHPRIYMSPVKEPCFFAADFPQRRISPDIDKYLSLFEQAGSQHLYLGEASPLYMRSNVALEGLCRFNPASRIIVMLRNPVDMLPSLHSERLFHFWETEPDFKTAWRNEGEGLGNPYFTSAGPNRYRDVVNFPLQVQRVLQWFPRQQVLFLLFDDLVKDPDTVYRQVLDFLELEHDGRQDFPRINENKDWKNKYLGKLLEQPPQALLTMLGLYKRWTGSTRVGWKDKIQAKTMTNPQRRPLSSSFRRELTDYFSEDITLLSELIGRDLTHWIIRR